MLIIRMRPKKRGFAQAKGGKKDAVGYHIIYTHLFCCRAGINLTIVQELLPLLHSFMV